ncbi:MAG TPA: PhnD/SsuA/transferrin family substrate-binding protein [Thiobacillus sp.]
MHLTRLLPALLGFLIHSPAHAIGKELVIGLQPTQPIRALIARHEPLANYLRQELDRPVRLVSAKNSQVFGQRMLAGDYELALAPAHFARLVQRERGWHPLVRYDHPLPVFLLSRQTETELMLADLKNKILAVPDSAMLVTVASEHWLAQQQLLAGRDYTLLVADGYASTVHVLISGQADMAVGALGGIGQARPEEIQQLRIVKEMGSIPRLVFVARHDMTAQKRATLQRALLAFRSPTAEPLSVVGKDDLAEVDAYLPETRARLKAQDILQRMR